MCVPDLRGSQGTFSFYSTAQDEHGHPARTGGEQTVAGSVTACRLGAHNPEDPAAGTRKLPFSRAL